MAGIVFWFENSDRDKFSGRQVDLDAWRYAIGAGCISETVCFNKSDYNPVLNAGYSTFKIIDGDRTKFTEWVVEHKDQNLLFIETEWSCPSNAINLGSVNHATIDWYIFGPSNGIPTECQEFGQWCYLPVKDRFALHPVHIASCVLTRRYEELLWRSH